MTSSERRMKIMDIVNDIAMNANNAAYVKVRAEDLIADLFCDCIGDGVMAMFHIVNGVPIYTLNTEFGSYTVPSSVVNDKLTRLTTQPSKAIPDNRVDDEKKKSVSESSFKLEKGLETDFHNKINTTLSVDEGHAANTYDEPVDKDTKTLENSELNSQVANGNNIQDESSDSIDSKTDDAKREKSHNEVVGEFNSLHEYNQESGIKFAENENEESIMDNIAQAIEETESDGNSETIDVSEKNVETPPDPMSADITNNDTETRANHSVDSEEINLEDEIAASIEDEVNSSSEYNALSGEANSAGNAASYVDDKSTISSESASDKDSFEEVNNLRETNLGENEQQKKHHFVLMGGFGKIKQREETKDASKSKFAALDDSAKNMAGSEAKFEYAEDSGTMFKHTHNLIITMKYNQSAVIGEYKVEFWPTWVQFGMTNQTFAECLVRISDSDGTEEISIIDRRNHEFSYKFPGSDYTFKMVGVWNSSMLTTSVSIDNDSKYMLRDSLTREEPEKLDASFLDQFELIAKGQPKYTILPLRNDNRGEENVPIIGIAEDNNTKILLRRMKGNTCQYTHNNRTRVITGHWERGRFHISIN